VTSSESEFRTLPHLAHWGAFRVTTDGRRVLAVDGHPDDPAPSPLHQNVLGDGLVTGRVRRPAIREGWLRNGPGPDDRRGSDRYVELPWDETLDILAAELRRVRDEHGDEAIYGGSYGWSSAGRFHHAQSQLHRFLNCTGGYTSSVNTYSTGATEVIVPHVLGELRALRHRATTWPTILEHTDLVVAFGGMNPKNTWVTPGGVTRHTLLPALAAAGRRGLDFTLVSPMRDDLPAEVGATWLPIVPGTDTAMMLALVHVLLSEDLADREFLESHTTGWERLADYVLGVSDGRPKDPRWAESITGIDAATITKLARQMSSGRTLVTVSWALQRAEHGEQPVWMGIALACMLGQIGRPGGGFGHGYGSMADVGIPEVPGALPTLPQGHNPVQAYIPVARITDLLTRPGEAIEYNGEHLTLPDIRLVYWAGGNPFHHHQNLSSLRRAMTRPDTVVVHEPFWTGTARHADVVLPVTTTLERDDIGAGRNDGYVFAMPRAVEPLEEARDDFAILAGLSERLGVAEEFTEGRDVDAWLEHLYERFRRAHGSRGVPLPDFEEFWSAGEIRLPDTGEHHTLFEEFRHDPLGHPLPTPSGRIELFSEVIDAFGYDDCPGHPAWLEPVEWLGGRVAERFPLALVANQPSTRLHSQLDGGPHSRRAKVAGREPIRIHPDDAAARGITDGDLVVVHNDRGSAIAGAVVTDAVRRGVVNLATGAWYTPADPGTVESMCLQGNPNVLTSDRGTSRLAQGSTGQLTMVDVQRFTGDVVDCDPYEPPLTSGTD